MTTHKPKRLTRRHSFNPESFAVVGLETPEAIANLRAGAIALYQPVNSQELFAVERIVLAQLSMLRIAALETDEAVQSFAKSAAGLLPLFLRYKAQTKRLHRRGVEDFERLKALRHETPCGLTGEPANEAKNEPIRTTHTALVSDFKA
jgi:hypothetical protein